jgi:hypothetical protein
MKKITGFLSLIVVIVTMSCNNQPAEVKPTTPEVKKEVVIVPPAPNVIIKEPAEKNTTIILDKKGVKVETKKVGVTVQP